MDIVTTPMCKKILEFAKIKDFKVNKHPDEESGDLAILLSESKTKMNSLKIKLNTFTQIKESILLVNEYSSQSLSNEDLDEIFSNYYLANKWIRKDKDLCKFREYNSKIKVKVYSKFLLDIVKDLNFDIVVKDYDYVIYPDYMEEKVVKSENALLVQIPTHKNISLDPIERAQLRYFILLNIEDFTPSRTCCSGF